MELLVAAGTGLCIGGALGYTAETLLPTPTKSLVALKYAIAPLLVLALNNAGAYKISPFTALYGQEIGLLMEANTIVGIGIGGILTFYHLYKQKHK